MNNYCSNCGNKLNEGEINCPKCGFSVIKNNNINLLSEKERSNASKAFVIHVFSLGVSICCFFLEFFGLSSILFFASIILLIWLKFYYPKIQYIKVWFWIVIICLVTSFVFLIIAIMSCANSIAGMG